MGKNKYKNIFLLKISASKSVHKCLGLLQFGIWPFLEQNFGGIFMQKKSKL